MKPNHSNNKHNVKVTRPSHGRERRARIAGMLSPAGQAAVQEEWEAICEEGLIAAPEDTTTEEAA